MGIEPKSDKEQLRSKYEELKREIQLGIDQLDRGECAELDLADTMRRARIEVSIVKREKRLGTK